MAKNNVGSITQVLGAVVDVKFEGDRGFVTVDSPRMYSLVANESVVSGSVTIRAETAGLAAYAFTFISCVVN